MDYEKAYREALERANMIYNDKYKPEIAAFAKKSLETIFPELKESEDEKVRKELIDAIQGLWDNDALPLPLSVKRKDAWLAWLEKLKVFAEHGDGLYYFRNKGFTYVDNPTWDNVSCLEKQGKGGGDE